jgi:cysteine desulfurase/selenocysteine lyase
MKTGVENVRRDFPFLERVIHGKKIAYLDNAATTQKPRRVIDALCDFYANHCANIHRGAHRLSLEASELYEGARGRVARFLGCGEHEVVFTRNATEGINLVAESLARPGEVLAPLSEHHSNLLPWRRSRRVRYAAIDGRGRLDLDDVRRQLTPEVAVVTVSQVTNVLGVVNPVAEVAKMAAAHGSLVLVDASQAAAHRPLDVQALGCDFLVLSGHKMLAPSGIGVLYARSVLLEGMRPYQVGGGTVKAVDRESSAPNDLPWLFEAGTPNIEGAVALGAAIDYIEGIGFDWVIEHERRLLARTIEGLGGVQGVEVHGPPACDGGRSGAVAFSLRGVESQVVARILSERQNVMVRSGFHCANPLHAELRLGPTVRASFSVYNTEEEVDLMIETLRSLRQFV